MDSIKDVENDLFYIHANGQLICKNNKLEKLTIPNEIDGIKISQVLGDGYFPNLKEIVFEEGIFRISGFYNSSAPKLEKVRLPNSIESLYAFYDTPFIINNYDNKTNMVINDGVLYSGKACSGNIKIPSNIRFIANQAFCCSQITSVEISNTIKHIGDYAFRYSKELEFVKLPDDIDILSPGIFDGCSNLVNINIPKPTKDIKNYAFRDCIKLKSIKLPDGLFCISDGAFDGCQLLTNINIPNSVKRIERCAFANCSGLEKIVIPNSVEILESALFFKCVNLKSVTLPSDIKEINELMFGECVKLNNVIIPKDVQKINKKVFFDCKKLNNISFESNNNLLYIGESAFQNTALTNIDNFPLSIKRICEKSFAGCQRLTSANLSPNTKDIDRRAFKGCQKLSSIFLPKQVYSFDFTAFEYCNSLKKITVPIANNYFSYNYSGYKKLEHLSLPLTKEVFNSYFLTTFLRNLNNSLEIRCSKKEFEDFIVKKGINKSYLSQDIIFATDVENIVNAIKINDETICNPFIIGNLSKANIDEILNRTNEYFSNTSDLNEKLKYAKYQQMLLETSDIKNTISEEYEL